MSGDNFSLFHWVLNTPQTQQPARPIPHGPMAGAGSLGEVSFEKGLLHQVFTWWGRHQVFTWWGRQILHVIQTS